MINLLSKRLDQVAPFVIKNGTMDDTAHQEKRWPGISLARLLSDRLTNMFDKLVFTFSMIVSTRLGHYFLCLRIAPRSPRSECPPFLLRCSLTR